MAQSVIVTGAGQGLGRAFSHSFAGAGYSVTACDTNAAGARKVAAEIRDAGGAAIAVEADVSVEAQCTLVAEQARAAHGRVDVLINNAAVRAHDRRPLSEIPIDEWDRFMAVNVRGPWLMIRAVLPHLRDAGSGSIINISSAAVLEAPVHQLQYVTSKAALIGLTRAAARELGEYAIRVNAILPSSLTTEIPKRFSDPAATARHLALKSLRRVQTPDDLVGVALFLASDASRYMTGQSINVDGGADFL